MYQALYRKYRPLEFEDVVGQDVIVNTLKNAINYNQVSHAYLFSGPRGTGKTTMAKIFARSVNCLDLKDGLACGKCKNCQYSFSKECMDIIEMDAASNNGVDEIRELRNKVNILPSELKYKVYIIDEVHMLSIGAFNALLKTIEEPPKHVIFILATTDPQKIPSTIVSRCQWYSFKKISSKDIVRRLEYIVSVENINIEHEVLEKIAESTDGGLRDAIGLLDKLRSFNPNNISVDDFYSINGQITGEEMLEFENLVFSLDIKSVLIKIEEFYQNGKNMIQIVKQLMSLIKKQMFDYYIDANELKYDEKMMIKFLNLLNEKIVDMKKADDVRLSVEITFLHYMNSNKSVNVEVSYVNKKEEMPNNIVQEVVDNNKMENKDSLIVSNNAVNKNSSTNTKFEDFQKLMLIRSKNAMATAVKSELKKEVENYKLLDDFTFDQNYGYLACELLDGKVRVSSEDAFVVSYDYESMIEKMSEHFDKINDFYSKVTRCNKRLAIITNDVWNNLREEYIKLLNENKCFDIEEEPILNVEDSNDKIDSVTNNEIDQVIELFGDIVEVE